MRVSLYPAACVAQLLIVVCAADFVAAQGPAGNPRPTAPATAQARPAPSGTNVAVVDIGFIFKNHNLFNTKLIALNEQGVQIDAEARAKQRELLKMKEELSGYKAGSPEFKQLDEKMTKEASDFDLYRRRKVQEFTADEAKLYYETYSQIEQEIARFAMQARIGLVLRHSFEPMKPEEPQTIKLGIMRPIIFQDRLDITKIILERVNAGTEPPPKANVAGGNAAAGGTTTGAAPPRTVTRPLPGSGSKQR